MMFHFNYSVCDWIYIYWIRKHFTLQFWCGNNVFFLDRRGAKLFYKNRANLADCQEVAEQNSFKSQIFSFTPLPHTVFADISERADFMSGAIEFMVRH